jgi:hypothetical protein
MKDNTSDAVKYIMMQTFKNELQGEERSDEGEDE